MSSRRVRVYTGSMVMTITTIIVVHTQHWWLNAQVECRFGPGRLFRAGIGIEETLGVRIPPTYVDI
jgi:hypothetical protein